MQNFLNRAKSFLKSEDGPTATEYAVMLALIIVVCIASIKAIGPKADAAFKSVGSNM
jgi:pilus assembly protein Flp/PilA